MSEHTPGPWTAKNWTVAPDCAYIQVGTKHFGVAQVKMAREPEWEHERKIHEANARLIAAAPDMLTEIEEALGWLDDALTNEDSEVDEKVLLNEILPKMADQFRKVLAKARGEQAPHDPGLVHAPGCNCTVTT